MQSLNQLKTGIQSECSVNQSIGSGNRYWNMQMRTVFFSTLRSPQSPPRVTPSSINIKLNAANGAIRNSNLAPFFFPSHVSSHVAGIIHLRHRQRPYFSLSTWSNKSLEVHIFFSYYFNRFVFTIFIVQLIFEFRWGNPMNRRLEINKRLLFNNCAGSNVINQNQNSRGNRKVASRME